MDADYPKELKCPEYPTSFRSIEYTPHIGIEFPDVNLVDWLKAPNSDEILYELALLGTKFFLCQEFKLLLDIARRANSLSFISCGAGRCLFPFPNAA